MQKFDVEALNNIPIRDVLELLGTEANTDSKKNVRCFNVEKHKDNDRHPSMAIYDKTNSCKCFTCNIYGKPINVVKEAIGGDFKRACEILHSQFNIPYLSNQPSSKTFVYKKQTQIQQPSIKYIYFDPNIQEAKIDKLAPYVEQYNKLSKAQRLKLIYSTIHRFSLTTNQTPKNRYYLDRGIENLDLISNIGFLGYNDIKRLELMLATNFPMEDLVDFKVFNSKRQDWNYSYNVTVVSAPDLYSNLITGFWLRLINPSPKGLKELYISCSDIVSALPFGLDNNALKKCKKIVVAEGHIDALSMRHFFPNTDTAIISFGGVFNPQKELLTLLKDKMVYLCFDKDEAGINGEEFLSKQLSLLNIHHQKLIWDVNDGKDINELLKANKLDTIRLIA